MKTVVAAVFPTASKTPAPPAYLSLNFACTFLSSVAIALLSATITGCILGKRSNSVR